MFKFLGTYNQAMQFELYEIADLKQFLTEIAISYDLTEY